jgi:undecaprenyl-diphosphatase
VDARLALWVATHRVGFLDDVFVGLGTIDKLGLVWVAAALAIGFGLRAGRLPTIGLAVLVAASALAADAVSFVVKDLVQRARPFEAHRQIHPLYVVHSSSFPAGHAATAFAGAVVLSYVAPRAAPVLLLVAVAIAFSRVYVGVHYPTDVLAGAAIGLAVGGVAIAALRLVLRHRGTSGVALNVSS